MSYDSYYNIYADNLVSDDDNFNKNYKLDDSKKEEIMKQLQEEMDELKAKYTLEDKKNKNLKTRNEETEENDKLKQKQFDHELDQFKFSSSSYNNLNTLQDEAPLIYSSDTVNNRLQNNNSYENNMLKYSSTINNDKSGNLSNNNFNNKLSIDKNENLNLRQSGYPYSSSIKETRSTEVNNDYNFNSKSLNNENAINHKSDFDLFEKAKDNLMQLKNELDELDDFNYKIQKYKPQTIKSIDNSTEKETFIKNNEKDLNQLYLNDHKTMKNEEK